MARALEDAALRRRALAAWSLVVAVAGGAGLLDALRSESHHAALPLGRHNLLAPGW